MINSLKIFVFIVVVVGMIAGFASLIPQVESPAPEVLEITGELSGADLAQLGHQVFESPEASCLACHGLGREGLRAPDLAGIGARAAERVAGQSAEQYIRESIVNPCAYVVEGYDCIMPQTFAQTLGQAKVTALIAFLESQGGEVTVRLSAADAEGGASAPGGVGVPGATPQEIMTGAGCVACHQVDAIGAAGTVGPNLSQVGARRTPEEIRQSILAPNAVIAEDCPSGPCPESVMPQDFGSRLSANQLETLVTFLSGLQ
jgi:mono/diheme cytochrome c family protein